MPQREYPCILLAMQNLEKPPQIFPRHRSLISSLSIKTQAWGEAAPLGTGDGLNPPTPLSGLAGALPLATGLISDPGLPPPPMVERAKSLVRRRGVELNTPAAVPWGRNATARVNSPDAPVAEGASSSEKSDRDLSSCTNFSLRRSLSSTAEQDGCPNSSTGPRRIAQTTLL